MKIDASIIRSLNLVLGRELIAINQYFLHARMYKNWGFAALNKQDYKMSIQKMKDADKLIERILFLEGLPNLQDLGKLHIGEEAEEIIQSNLGIEMTERDVVVAAIKVCEEQLDYISRDLLEDILEHIEEQVDWLETQQYLIKHSGLQNYLQAQMAD